MSRRGYVHPMRVTITGAAGRIGRHLTPGLAALGHDVRGIDRVSPDEPWAGDVVVADIGTNDDALAVALSGADAVVHLAANPGESSFAEAIDSHLRLTHRVLEGARDAGIGRVVYASSNHAVGFTPRAAMVPVETRIRPDTFYGFGKAAAEALCSLYHDRYGMAIACLRIGTFREWPQSRRELGSWLSVGDGIRLVDACLRSPALDFAIVYGISANTRRWWDLDPARALGYEPLDDAERWADEIEAIPPTEDDELDYRYLGGWLARPG
jgi:uronate dehydrogenase